MRRVVATLLLVFLLNGATAASAPRDGRADVVDLADALVFSIDIYPNIGFSPAITDEPPSFTRVSRGGPVSLDLSVEAKIPAIEDRCRSVPTLNLANKQRFTLGGTLRATGNHFSVDLDAPSHVCVVGASLDPALKGLIENVQLIPTDERQAAFLRKWIGKDVTFDTTSIDLAEKADTSGLNIRIASIGPHEISRELAP